MTNHIHSSRPILVLDDDPTFGQLIQRVAKRHRLEVIYCDTIRQFVDHAVNSDFSVALIDYNLPEFSGEQVAQLVEEKPVYIISSDDRIAANALNWSKGISGFISKQQLSGQDIIQFIKHEHFRREIRLEA